jgi:hypothetical protein
MVVVVIEQFFCKSLCADFTTWRHGGCTGGCTGSCVNDGMVFGNTFVNPFLALELDFQGFLEIVWPLPSQLRENFVIQSEIYTSEEESKGKRLEAEVGVKVGV